MQVISDAFARQDDALNVAVVGRKGNERIIACPNMADPTTWYEDSERVTLATLQDVVGSLYLRYEHPNQYKNWIDLIHGKVLAEDTVSAEGPEHGYSVVVTVDDVEKTARPPFATDWTEGGDYYIDHANGQVVFQASQFGKTVKASFSYENGSGWSLIPTDGYQLEIEEAEVQFSADSVMNDTFIYEYFGWAIVFAPELVPDPLGPYDLVSIGTTKYKSVGQVIDEARGAFPVIPAVGGSLRGVTQNMYGFPFKYGSVRVLKSSCGMRLRAYLESDKKFGGERMTATFYCAETVDPDWTG